MGTGNCGARRLVNLRLSPPACRWISSPVVVSSCPACRSGGAPRAVNKRLINWPSASIILGQIRNDLSKDVRITVAEIISSRKVGILRGAGAPTEPTLLPGVYPSLRRPPFPAPFRPSRPLVNWEITTHPNPEMSAPVIWCISQTKQL